MVTVRPNFQDSVHVGFVAGLKKFAEYLTSVLCFTTPGDGPRSPPQLVRTHEDGTGRRLRGGSEQPRGGAGDTAGTWHGVPPSPLRARPARGCRGLPPCVAAC